MCLIILGESKTRVELPKQRTRGGVAIYIRNNRDIHPQFSNISPTHKDILAVDLKLHNSPLTIINCYPHGKSLKDTVDAITNINIPMDRPCIMAGDFNLHHPEWALTGSKWEKHQPNAQERMFKAYAEYQDLHVLNHLSLPTHIVPRSPASNAIIDLTLLNSQAVDAWPNLNWEVEAQSSGKSLGSDHMAITWTIGPHDQAKSVGVTEPSPRHLIDTSRQKKWTQEYMRQVQKNPPPTDPLVAKDADRMTSTILEAMSNATRLVMPLPPCQKRDGPVRSPWWTDCPRHECSKAVHNLKHNPDQKPREQLRAALQGAIRRARKCRGDKILAEISTQRVFNVLKWYQGKRRSIIPPICHPSLDITATHPHDKAKHLGLQFFPQVNSPHVTLEPLGLKSSPQRPHHPITSAEVRSALELTSNCSAPGAFGSNYQLLKWAFNASPEIFIKLFNLCLEIGYHPTALRNCIIAPIPKPNRADMSTPKNYCPIALLETLSKLLEKVVTARLLHEAGEHALIPQAQFGGKDITSCTDAGLCMVHNIRAAWKSNKAALLLTLDVSGYFNNVDHSRLIYTLERLGYSTNICNWLKSYLSNRTAQFRIDGVLCPHFQLPDVGIPQGSPLSPVLSSLYSIPLLLASTDPQAHSFAYIDNFTILAYSHSHQENINIITKVIKNINQVAIKLGLEFELPKSDLIHFIRSPKTPHSNPSLTFSHSGTDTTISPKDVVRWLGFFLDRRLNFKEHIQTMAIKAKATLAGLRMLANSQNGLSVRHAHILFKASVTPILTYGLPLWFHGRRQLLLLEPLRKVQNQGLRWILGAFRTTPSRCMEHLASIPPLHIACLRIIENLASKLKSIPALAEVARRLPPEWDSSTEVQRNPKSPITFAASLSHPDTEFITPYLVHPSKPNIPWPGQLEIEHKSPAPLKKAAAKIIQNEIDEAESNHLGNTVHGFSDGHAGTLNGVPKVGLGYIVKYGHKILARNSHSIGPRANIYDAEMLGIAMCLNSAVRTAEQVQAKRIIIYCDNQAAVKAISSLHRHPAQYASRAFHQHAQRFLEKDPTHHITVKWLPGHSKIDGNELADEAAKGSETLQPTPVFNRTITWSRTRATKRATTSWGRIWNEHIHARPDSNTYIPRPPALKLHPIFNRPTYPRNVQCRLVQFLTGHGFYGAYSARFHPHIDPQCQCGEPSQTPEHMLMFCPETEKYRHIITDASPEHSWEEIFGTLPGLEAVSEFILKSGIGKCRDPPATAHPL
ncbi:Reverse transcriptase (RNA-dependent DNA polymerase), partial [Rhizoctonia solani]